MPSASSNNNNNSTKPVKQSAVKSVSGGVGPNSRSHGASNAAASCDGNNVDLAPREVPTNLAENNVWQNKLAAEKKNNLGGTQCLKEPDIAGPIDPSTGITSMGASREPNNDVLNPMKMTITTIEHKIRNLEKRKTKLESYRAIQASGKELSSDQRAAVAKFDAVTATLDFARDLVKQMQQFTKDAEKEQKKQMRKDLIAKAQAETIKIREVLIIQNVLSCFTDETIRNDFISGENGAAKLDSSEMELLEKFCLDVQTRRPETSEDFPFATTAQKAAEIFSMTIDGRPKQYANTTYENVRRIFQRIQESNYLDKIYLTDGPVIEQLPEEAEIQNENIISEGEASEGEHALEEDSEKIITDHANVSFATDVPEVLATTATSASILKDQIDLQTSNVPTNQPVINLPVGASAIGQGLLQATPMAPPATAVPAFQTISPAPPPSGNNTPVHVALFAHQTGMQTSDQQPLPQMGASALTTGVPQPAGPILPGLSAGAQQPIQQISNQQRQLLKNAAQSNVAPVPHLQNAAAPPLHGAFTVHTVEQTFFKQHQQQQQQFLQQIHPLADVIGGGNFYFLQESELDSPDPNGNINQPGGVYDQQQLTVSCGSTQMHVHNPKPAQLLNEPDFRSVVSEQPQQQPTQPSVLITQKQADVQHQAGQTASLQHIQTQTFTNQSFPQIAPTGSLNVISNNTGTSVLFHSQTQKQPASTQFFSHVDVDNVLNPPGPQILKMTGSEQTLQSQSPQQTFINMSHLDSRPAMPNMLNNQSQSSTQSVNACGPNNMSASNITQQQQNHQTQNLASPTPDTTSITDKSIDTATQNTRFAFDNSVAGGINTHPLNTTVEVLKNVQDNANVSSNTQQLNNPLNKPELIPEFHESSLTNKIVNEDNIINSNTRAKGEQKKWSNESDDSVVQVEQQPHQQLQSQIRKNEWSPSTTTATPTATSTTIASVNNAGDGNDSTHLGDGESRSDSNPWHTQPEIIPQGGYGRGNRNSGNYDRRNRDDRRTGGPGSAGNYRGNRSNYGSGGQQQNSNGARGAGTYFRSHDNGTNSYYQNGGNSGGNGGHTYNTHKETSHRFESCPVGGNAGGNTNFRGPRNSGGNNGSNVRYNSSSTRSLGPNRNSNNTSGLNSTAFMNSRQVHNRVGMDKKN